MNCPTTNSSATLPVLSLVVALLAVFVGPILTWKLTGRQIKEARDATDKQLEAAKRSANKQIVAPMREAWISKLREKIAQFIANLNYVTSMGNQAPMLEAREIQRLQVEITLMLNPNEPDHNALVVTLLKLTNLLSRAHRGENCTAEYGAQCGEVFRLSQIILRKEWNRVKTEDAN